MGPTSFFAVVTLTLAMSGPPEAAQAQPARTLQLDFHVDGTVSLSAQNVSVREILSEWARQCGCYLVNWDKVAGGPLTMPVQFERTTQAKVLESLLRQATGYVLTPKRADSRAVSNYETIYILPSSATGESASAALVAQERGQLGPRLGEADFFVTTDPFPKGPSPAEEEVARLQAKGLFNPDAKEDSLLGLAHHPDPVVRARALQTLAVQNTPAGSRALTDALEDENPFVRAEALDLAVSLGPGMGAVRRLGDLLDHKDPAVRVSAARALGEQPGVEAESQLRRAADSDDDAVKNVAAQLLQQKEAEKETERNRRPGARPGPTPTP